jgi:DNA-binding NtrC family response regulator
MAVIELRVPSLEERGETDKIAIFRSIVMRILEEETHNEAAPPEIPLWLLQMVARTQFQGNVRELRNIAERTTIIHRQFGDWDKPAINRVFDALRDLRTGDGDADPSGRKKWEGADRNRILEALDAHNWRRQDTANYLNISRKVLWEKMRKLQIVDANPEIAGETDA